MLNTSLFLVRSIVMTYETETRLDQTASALANGVKKIWRRPELDRMEGELTRFGGAVNNDGNDVSGDYTGP
jgi:hypothetical protein